MRTKPKLPFAFFITCLILLSSVLYANAATVTGTVTDQQGNPLAGVTVQIKEGTAGTSSDARGNYSLQVENGQVIVFSFIGYEKKEITYTGQAHLDVQLFISSTNLDQVIVEVGYGTQRKVSLTSAVSQISGGELDRRPVTSIQQALQGKLPGLTILDKGGNPGSPNTQILVRGVNTPYTPVGGAPTGNATIGDNGPLVIVDGVEQPFQNINPADID
ncbi:MAG TPA: carboxypeptidase-like regulatory domain-containing protein, partial [Puia sp.]|nr:carboxypeptidase-like regulatory domain-containing protein [Puia sp.]